MSPALRSLRRRGTDRHPLWKVLDWLATAAVLLAVGQYDAGEHLRATGLRLDTLDLVNGLLRGTLAFEGIRLTKG